MTEAPVTAVYLDHQATTPVDPRVLDLMLPFFSGRFGNPHATVNAFGRDAAGAVERARAEVATALGADPREVIFTSGATEANNLAIKGAARFHKARVPAGAQPHIITVATEHKCVLESCRELARDEGFRVTFLPVADDGLLDLADLRAALDDHTVLVSVMAVNNEIGVIQPIAEIAALAHGAGAVFHTDIAQAVGKIPLDLAALGVDLASVSGHKIYGPKGIGALFVRRRPRARLVPLFSGGGQERGLRAGTLPTPLCVGLGAATRLAAAEHETETARLTGLRDQFWQRVSDGVPDATINGHRQQRVAGNLNIHVPGAAAIDMLTAMPDVAISTGSACTSTSVEPSYVLRALGLDSQVAGQSLRIGFGRFTTTADVDFAAGRIIETARHVRAGPVTDSIEAAAQ